MPPAKIVATNAGRASLVSAASRSVRCMLYLRRFEGVGRATWATSTPGIDLKKSMAMNEVEMGQRVGVMMD
jgi:hypothetical protein